MGGVATAVKSVRPEARVVAVELAAGPGLGPGLGRRKALPGVRGPTGTLADGMTPPFVGALPLAIVKRFDVEIATVTEDEIMGAMRALMSRAKLVAEGSGAAATAALLANRIAVRPGATVVVIVSGGNIDPERFGAVLVMKDC